MLTLYTWGTPNGRKPLILLEELEFPYEIVPVDIRAGEQRKAEYLRTNPNGKIPALLDRDTGVTIFESGAILVYLAEKAGQLLPTDAKTRGTALSWLFFQMSAIGPTLAQADHFASHRETSAYACEHFRTEAIRLYGVLDTRLAESRYLAGDDYTIADIATWPWIYHPSTFSIEPGTFRHIDAWISRIAARTAVQAAMAIPFT